MTDDTSSGAAPTASWGFPTRMRLAPGAIAEAGAMCRDAGMRRVLIVTDPGVRAAGLVAGLEASLEAAGLASAVFDAVSPNPTGEDVEAGVEAYRQHGADGVAAIGGGSGLDAGKAVALMQGQSRPIWDFEDIGANWKRADPAGIAPVLAIPTTAGTGSEVGRASVITNSADHTKRIVYHPKMMPAAVILDPELTVGMPAWLTAATGMDALTHCIEAYCAPGFHPMADAIALRGVEIVAAALPAVMKDGGDLKNRALMLTAASMGCVALQKGLGAVHALAHTLGGLYGSHHGMLNAVLLPAVLTVNAPGIEARLADLHRALGCRDGETVMDHLAAMNRALGLPETLAALGVEGIDEPAVVERALADPTAGGNPVPLTAEMLKEMLRLSA